MSCCRKQNGCCSVPGRLPRRVHTRCGFRRHKGCGAQFIGANGRHREPRRKIIGYAGRGKVNRWFLRETIRAYALKKLTEDGDAETAARHHATYFRDLFTPLASGARSSLSDQGLARCVVEIDNLHIRIGAMRRSFHNRRPPSCRSVVGWRVWVCWHTSWWESSAVICRCIGVPKSSRGM